MSKKYLLLTVLAAAACGDGNNGMTGNEPRGAYPAGPYGKAENSIIEPVSFVLHDGMPWMLENVWKDNTKKLLLITTSAGWCTACIDEQPALVTYHHEWGPKGLAILEAIFENASYEPATLDYTSDWKRQYELPFDVVADMSFKLGDYYNRDLSPMNMIVDVTSMKILRISSGFDPNATEAIFEARLQ